MKLFNKIKLHPLALFVLAAGLISGYFRYIMAIFMIVFLHELGHVFFAKLFKRKVVAITILPFGGLTKLEGKVSENIYEDLLIASGGIFFQTILGFAIIFLYLRGSLDWDFFKFLNTYNIFIIVFNLLPICPLDGYKMVRLICELAVPYKLAYGGAIIVSFLFLGGFVISRWDMCKNNFLVIVFLVFMAIQEIRTHKYACLKFYLERMNYHFYYARIDVPTMSAMFKNKINYIEGIHEKEYLRNHFTSKSD